jgi:hypothetical protein
MKLLLGILLLSFCFPSSDVMAHQSATKAPAPESDFLIDPSKPYVYLELDHVGPRRPLREGEPGTGLWLRLKNNCRLPIVVMAYGSLSAGDEVLSVADEVVRNPHAFGKGDGGAGGILARQGLEGMTDIFIFPNMTEAEIAAAEDMEKRAEPDHHSKKAAERPHGYNAGNEPMSPTITEIPPGKQLLFSLPASHVSESWHIEIPFRLALANTSGIRPPYSYVAFYDKDLKEPAEHAAPSAPPAP